MRQQILAYEEIPHAAEHKGSKKAKSELVPYLLALVQLSLAYSNGGNRWKSTPGSAPPCDLKLPKNE